MPKTQVREVGDAYGHKVDSVASPKGADKPHQ